MSDLDDWNRNADAYVEGATAYDEKRYPNNYIHELLGDVTGMRVLDVGCGDGRLCAYLCRQGARVVGTDGASKLLVKAKENAPGVSFHKYDLTSGLPDLGAPFDLIISVMTVMDIPDISPLFRDISSALTPSGRFVFTILHPPFWNQKSTQDADTGVV